MSADDRTPGQVAAEAMYGRGWWSNADSVWHGVLERGAAAVLAHEAAARKPRMWPRGVGADRPDPLPPAVRDGDGILWQLDEEGHTYWCAERNSWGQGWGMLTCDGPLVEVYLPPVAT